LRAALARPADAERAAELAELYARGDVGELHRAAAFALRALRVDPANARAWKAFGAARLSAGAFGEARAALERAAALASRDAGAQRLLGDALVALGEREGAERAYRAALRADESDGAARYELACLLEERGDLEGARAELERAIATGSGHPSPFYRLARVLDALGDADGAEEMRRLHERATILDDRRLLEIGVSELERRLTLGAWYLDHGRPGDARPEYEAALELAKTDAEAVPALIGLTDLCTRVGELELARERLDALRRADAADPRIPLLEQRLDAARASATGGAAIGADEGEL
jgi:tetratricopeptide (TPR) repeat protein